MKAALGFWLPDEVQAAFVTYRGNYGLLRVPPAKSRVNFGLLRVIAARTTKSGGNF